MHFKKTLVCTVSILLLLATSPFLAAEAAIYPGITLGSPVYSGGAYSYPGAIVYGAGIRTLLISFPNDIAVGDQIILPSVTPAGFTVSPSSAANDYSKRINLDLSVSVSALQSYVRGVTIRRANATQTVRFTVTTENITVDTFYRAANQHYYQYFAYAPGTTGTWTDAYDAARLSTYMGMTGYLATVTSLNEDQFVSDLFGKKTGWLGGTYMGHSAGGTALYYDSFLTGSENSTGWYWACGPEKGDIFYNIRTLDSGVPGSTAQARAAYADALNPSTYYNWTRPTTINGGYEPNGSTERCLTILFLENSGTPVYGKQGTLFSWNNIDYNRSYSANDVYMPRGYFVEYGNLIIGDSGNSDPRYASATGSLVIPPVAAQMPQTGDPSNLPLLLGLFAASGIGCALLAVWIRRKSPVR